MFYQLLLEFWHQYYLVLQFWQCKVTRKCFGNCIIYIFFFLYDDKGADVGELEAALSSLHLEFKAGVFEYAHDTKSRLALLWRADQVLFCDCIVDIVFD
jgi:hypothetical protein